jgi:hypothetical protein
VHPLGAQKDGSPRSIRTGCDLTALGVQTLPMSPTVSSAHADREAVPPSPARCSRALHANPSARLAASLRNLECHEAISSS